MLSIKKENNELKISFDKFNIGFVKNIPFLLLSIMSIPFVYYSLGFLITLINHTALCLLHSLPIIYNADPFYKLIILMIFTMCLFDICIIYKLFPQCKLFDMLYETNTKSEILDGLKDIVIGIIPISLFILFSAFYLIGFWSNFGDPKDLNFLHFCVFTFHFIYSLIYLIVLVLTIICNMVYFFDLIQKRYLT